MDWRNKTPAENYAEAERRIENWQPGEALDLSGLSELEEIPESIAELKELEVLYLSNLDESRSYYLPTKVSELNPLRELANLQHLNCRCTHVCDLSPLSELTNLQVLDCGYTQVSDLSPLSGLSHLQSFDCCGTVVSDLSPLSSLSNLQDLNCSQTEVSDLSPLRGLNKLEVLDCSQTQVVDLSPLSGLSHLRSFSCFFTKVSDLSPLCKLTNLIWLDCSDSSVTDLNPISGLYFLTSLFCDGSGVSDLSPLNNLYFLSELDAYYCPINTIDYELVFGENLESLCLGGSKIVGIPAEALSAEPGRDCLPKLRAHLTDLAESQNQQQEAKLMIIGNGRVGKTQICRQLSNLEFEQNSDSTHGITISSTSVPNNESARFHLWDFGGQDIYHGTHALFMRSRSVFLLAWTPEMEDSETHTYGGMSFRNYPLLYWLNYIKQFGGTDCSVIIVQTHCDEPGQVQTLPSDVYAMLGEFRYWKALDYSALNNRGRAALDEALTEAYQQIDQPFIGVGRQRVIDQLQTWIDDDSKRLVEQRQHRTIQYNDFVMLCENTGDISSPELFLDFLHNCGNVFYQQGLFNNQIILDQAWAFEAIYAVFNRDNCYKILKEKMHGKFDRDVLAMLLWNELGFSEQEQILFIHFMVSCSICFCLDKHWQEESLEEKYEYLAPDLLPDEPPQDLTEKWQPDIPIENAVFSYDLLPSVLLRNFMAEVGRDAGLAGDYWHNGFFVPERTTLSRALITQTKTGNWQGEICIQTQGLGAEQLLTSLINQLERVEQKIGIRATQKESALDNTKLQHEFADNSDMKEPEFEPDYAQEKPQQKEYFVSYAWNDDKTDAGKTREEKVNQLCTDAEAKFGISIVRDKNTLQFGDSITKFMNRIGKGERVFIFLSDKYLKSANCMYELHQIWVQSKQDGDRLSEVIRVFTLDDAQIWEIENRLEYSAYWNAKHEKLEAAIEKFGIKSLSKNDMNRYVAIKKFANTVGEVLTEVADRVQPRKWQDFLEYGFQE
ncbi:leucine-rich repeat domain-containing protein [Sessilibacter corallicola]|uniref:leucine-rich repeat domain-containing protein n=1 Tax=Sessilibacter corallicola TaxID=2904075 RepID=UPI001E4BA98B|nr:leucine-rich repeat domain-containing protein [Sessilibacter corallicola]MCE2026757.1 TIR domain-containing protein [Sessilibacter corallicola]